MPGSRSCFFRVRFGATRLIFQLLSRRKIYVNRHVDTCLNVDRSRSRDHTLDSRQDGGGAAKVEEKGRQTRRQKEEGGRRVGSRVTGMQCRISPCPPAERARRRRERDEVYREERRNTPQGVHACTLTCTHTRVTRTLGLHPSHESKLFEAEKEIRNGARERS